MTSSTLGGVVREEVRRQLRPPVREGRVSRVIAPGVFEVRVRSLMGDVKTLRARGPSVPIERDTPVWVAEDEGGQLAVVSWVGGVGGAPAAHDHDDRYFTEAESTAALALKQDAATAATDSELEAHRLATLNVHGIPAVVPTGHGLLRTASGWEAVDLATQIRKGGVLVGTRRKLNLIEGAGVTLTVADDATNEEVDVTIAAAGGSSPLAALSIAAEETRLDPAYGVLATPDRLTFNVNGPSDLVSVYYEAQMLSAIASAIANFAAGMFLDGVQVQAWGSATATEPYEVVKATSTTLARSWPIVAGGGGFIEAVTNATAERPVPPNLVFGLREAGANKTMAAGPLMLSKLAAGAHTIEVRFKTAANVAVRVRDRQMRVAVDAA